MFINELRSANSPRPVLYMTSHRSIPYHKQLRLDKHWLHNYRSKKEKQLIRFIHGGSCSRDEQKKLWLHITSTLDWHVKLAKFKSFCFQTGNFTASHPNNRANAWEFFSNFGVVSSINHCSLGSRGTYLIDKVNRWWKILRRTFLEWTWLLLVFEAAAGPAAQIGIQSPIITIMFSWQDTTTARSSPSS